MKKNARFLIIVFAFLVFTSAGCSKQTPPPAMPNALPPPADSVDDGDASAAPGTVEPLPLGDTTSTEPTQNQQPEAIVMREKGSSTGTIPYAPINKDGIVSATLDREGGVLKTMLSGNVKAFLIIPRDSIIGSAEVSLVPYTAMPAGPTHPALNNSFGYGVQVFIQSVQSRIDAYLVFDTSGGAISHALNDTSKLYKRCDPESVRFGPFICGLRNGVPAGAIIQKDAGIVTPIHTHDYNHLVFTRNTIPAGIPGLMVTRITRGDVFIPQRFDKALVRDLVPLTLGKYDSAMERLEAGALAQAWDIPLSVEQVELVADSLTGAEHYDEQKKEIVIAGMVERYARAQAQATRDEDMQEEWNYLVDDITRLSQRELQNMIESARFDTDKQFSDESYHAAAGMMQLAAVGYAPAQETLPLITASLNRAYQNPPKQDDETLDAGEAGTVIVGVPGTPTNPNTGEQPGASGGGGLPSGGQTPPGDTGTPSVDAPAPPVDPGTGNQPPGGVDAPAPPAPPSPGGTDAPAPPSGSDAGGAPEPGRQGAGPKVLELTDIINDIVNDPQSSVTDLLDAAALAQAMGLENADAITKKALDRIAKKIENTIKNRGGSLGLAGLAQSIGRDDLADSALANLNEEQCDLIKKTLANYGINECK